MRLPRRPAWQLERRGLSALEIAELRQALGPSALIVGRIRRPEDPAGDQQRTASLRRRSPPVPVISWWPARVESKVPEEALRSMLEAVFMRWSALALFGLLPAALPASRIAFPCARSRRRPGPVERRTPAGSGPESQLVIQLLERIPPRSTAPPGQQAVKGFLERAEEVETLLHDARSW